jgi:hypothetical protein
LVLWRINHADSPNRPVKIQGDSETRRDEAQSRGFRSRLGQ